MRTSMMVAVGLMLSVSSPALAVLPPPQEAPLGWSKDGAFFATNTEDQFAAIDARTGKRTTFNDRADFEKWTAAHPLKEDVAESGFDAAHGHGPASPDGKVKLNCPTATFNEGAWSNGGAFQCTLARGDTRLPLRRGAFSGRLEIFWSPDGRRVAWHHSDQKCTPSMGDFACDFVNDIVIDRTVGPRLSVVAFGDDAAALGKALDALEKAGFVPTQVGPAKKARDTTAVYAAKGMDAEAKRVAAVFGVKVEPLTWKSDADVVVALGK
jgi:hypothetical protein